MKLNKIVLEFDDGQKTAIDISDNMEFQIEQFFGIEMERPYSFGYMPSIKHNNNRVIFITCAPKHLLNIHPFLRKYENKDIERIINSE